MRTGIIVGHERKRPGAFSKTMNKSEYQYNSELAELIKRANPDARIFFRDKGGIKHAFKDALAIKPAAILELHFNSFNGKATGTEVLFSDNWDAKGLKELALATILSRNISSTLGLVNRGVKERAGSPGERGFANLMQTTSIASVLLEHGFGDNPVDATAMMKKQKELAQTIVDGLKEWSEKV